MTTATDKLLDEDEAAELLGLKPQTLSTWRSTGRYNLPYLKAGRRVRYKLSDLERWMQGRTRTSTAAD